MMGIRNFFKKKSEREKLLPLDPDRIRENRVMRAMAEELRSKDAQISELLAERRKEKEEEIEEDKQELLRQRLKKEETEIKKSKFGIPASLRNFLNDKKLLEKCEVCDKDDRIVFGKFGDILLLDSGRMALTDSKGNVLSLGKNIDNVIYKPGSFLHQIKRGRILIPYDKDYNPAIDWEEVEIEDIKYDEEEQVYRLTEQARQTAKNLLIQKDKEIRILKKDYDRIENQNIDLNKELDEAKRTIKMQKSQVENTNSELSTIMNQVQQFQLAYGDTQRKIVSLTEVKGMYEDIIKRQEVTIKGLLDDLEESGDKTIYRKAKEDIKEDMDYVAGLKERVKEKVIVEEHVKIEDKGGEKGK